MLDKKIARKLAHLTQLMNNPMSRKEGSELRIFHELFLMTREGSDLSPETLDWLNEIASLFLSPSLLDVLSKLRLQVYGFKFAALHLIDIEDVTDELSNGKILKNIHYLPPGAFNKLKRELLGPLHYYAPWDKGERATQHYIAEPTTSSTVSFQQPQVQQGLFVSGRVPYPNQQLGLAKPVTSITKQIWSPLMNPQLTSRNCRPFLRVAQIEFATSPMSSVAAASSSASTGITTDIQFEMPSSTASTAASITKAPSIFDSSISSALPTKSDVASFSLPSTTTSIANTIVSTVAELVVTLSKANATTDLSSPICHKIKSPATESTKSTLDHPIMSIVDKQPEVKLMTEPAEVRKSTPSLAIKSLVGMSASVAKKTTGAIIASRSGGSGSPNVSSSVGSDEDNIHFERVQTEEEVVYCQRATLFHISPNGKWKERGLIGDIQILRDSSTGSKRFLMRRKRIWNICLNHPLTSDLSFQPKGKRFWLWTAQDFSVGKGKTETFGIRFRNAKTSKAFMVAVLGKQNSQTEINDNQDESKETSTTIEDEEDDVMEDVPAAMSSASTGIATGIKFEMPSTASTSITSVTKVPSVIESGSTLETPSSSSSSTKSVHSFSLPSLSTSLLPTRFIASNVAEPTVTPSKVNVTTSLSSPIFHKPKSPVTKSSQSTLDHPISILNEKAEAKLMTESAKISKSTPSSTANSLVEMVESDQPQKFGRIPFQFDVGESGFDSSTLMKLLPGTGTTTSFFPKSTTTEANLIIKSGCSRLNVPSSVGSDGDNTHCPRVKSVEEVVYSKRATLFRISPYGKWKEQGFGYIHILRDLSTGAKRFLMVRKRIGNICLNHELTSDLSFQPKGKTCWLWTAQDFAEGKAKTETFGIRFQNPRNSKAFMAAVSGVKQNSQKRNQIKNDESKEEKSTTIEDEEDVMADEIDEDIFFTHRAKLYRFMSSVYEWKRKLNFDAVKSLKSGKNLRNNRTRIHRYRTRCDEEADWFSD